MVSTLASNHFVHRPPSPHPISLSTNPPPFFKRDFMSTETAKTIRGGESRNVTLIVASLLNSGPCTPDPFIYFVLTLCHSTFSADVVIITLSVFHTAKPPIASHSRRPIHDLKRRVSTSADPFFRCYKVPFFPCSPPVCVAALWLAVTVNI